VSSVGTTSTVTGQQVSTGTLAQGQTFTYALTIGADETTIATVPTSPPQPTSFSAISGTGTYGGTATVMATLTSGGSPVVGVPITFTLNKGGTVVPAGTATTDAKGVAALSGVDLGGFSAGTLTEAVGTSFAGDDTDGTSSASGALTVAPGQAVLSLDGLVFTYDGAPHTATVTTSPAGLSGVTVSYTLNNVAVAAPTQPGTYTVVASLDNPNYTAASVTGTLAVNAALPAGAPPHATAIVHTARSRKGLTAITVAFDEALDPSSTGNKGLYGVFGPVKKRTMTVYSKPIAINAVNYDSNAHTVTINLARPFKGKAQVTVRAGIVGANGMSSGSTFSAFVG
jgi:hypothetical protein